MLLIIKLSWLHFFFKLKTMGLIVVECFARQGLLEIKDLSSAVR